MPKIKSTQPPTVSAHRLQALETIHAITTASDSSPSVVYEQIVLVIADMLKTPLTMIRGFDYGTQVYNGKLSSIRGAHHCSTCFKTTESTDINRSVCVKNTPSIKANCFPHEGFQSFLSAPILDSSGVVIGAVCAFDTPGRKFTDNEAHFMEIFARYLTNRLSQKQRESNDKRLFEHNLFTQLTQGITNEVRNRLNGIYVNTEALFQEIGDNYDIRLYQKHINKQVNCLATLMKELHALGEPIEKESLKEVSICSLVSEALSYWRQSVPKATRKVNLALLSSKQANVKVDDMQLKSAVVTLLTNAHNNTPLDGEVRLSVSSVQNQWARIRVTYTGAGILPEHLSRAFDPFFFNGKSSTGLGLSIVKHVVECHGGTISIFNSVTPPGVTIELNLPLSEQPADIQTETQKLG